MSWWNPYTERGIELRTRLSPAECHERLRGRVAGWLEWFPSVTRPLKGRVTEAGFAIHRFQFGRHGFETEARGRFEADASGTRIGVRFGLKHVDVIFIGFWILLVFWMAWVFLLAPGRPPGSPSGEEEFPRWLPALMVGVLALSYAGVRWYVRGDAEFLVRLIRETLGASEAQEQAPID